MSKVRLVARKSCASTRHMVDLQAGNAVSPTTVPAGMAVVRDYRRLAAERRRLTYQHQPNDALESPLADFKVQRGRALIGPRTRGANQPCAASAPAGESRYSAASAT